MRIKKLRVINYKSFENSGWIEFAPAFNVVVGKNSAGKTALLEAFRLNQNAPRPHLSASRRKGAPHPDQSTFELEIHFDEHEMRDSLLRRGNIDFPIPAVGNSEDVIQHGGVSFIQRYLQAPSQSLLVKTGTNSGFSSENYPSHGLFNPIATKRAIRVSANPDRTSFKFEDFVNSAADSVPTILEELLPRKLYVFQAQRLNIGTSEFTEARVLNDDASNLPQVLFALTTNPVLFDRYNRHVNEIFPYIKRVVVFPKSNQLDVRLWWVDPVTERDDLAVPLRESGTGVGQALAILYVAMTIDRGIIVIDEPNSFLHPGAAKKLIEILRQYEHQYIVSTHSPEIVSAANPNAVFVTHWNNGDTKIEKLERLTLSAQRSLLNEIGVSAMDVFGADKIVWVEGQTEEECFPIVLQRAVGSIEPGLDFLAVRSVDEIVRKQRTDAIVTEIYEKLTGEATLQPKLLRFSFDRERRPAEYISKMENETKGRVRFLPVRHYECFLLNVPALCAVLSAETAQLNQPPISLETVTDWANENANNFSGDEEFGGSLENAAWRRTADAASLLKKLFFDIAKIEYSKTKHSRALTEWLLDHDSPFLEKLSNYVVDIVSSVERP